MQKSTMAITPPSPQGQLEISVDIDDDPRAAYFQQVKLGMRMRMALEVLF